MIQELYGRCSGCRQKSPTRNCRSFPILLGADAIPDRWLAELELREEIETLADDLFKQFEDTQAWSDRYPGW